MLKMRERIDVNFSVCSSGRAGLVCAILFVGAGVESAQAADGAPAQKTAVTATASTNDVTSLLQKESELDLRLRDVMGKLDKIRNPLREGRDRALAQDADLKDIVAQIQAKQ